MQREVSKESPLGALGLIALFVLMAILGVAISFLAAGAFIR